MKARTEYHEVPAQWAAPQLLAAYACLAKRFHVAAPRNLTTDVAHPLVQTWYALHQLSLGIKDGDQACISLSVDFIASPSYFSGSGHLKASMARRLKQVQLDQQTAEAVRKGLLTLWSHGNYRQEWREYFRLLAHIGIEGHKKELSATIERCHPGTRRYVRQLLAEPNTARIGT